MPEFPVTTGVGPGGPSRLCWGDQRYTDHDGSLRLGACDNSVDAGHFELGLCERHRLEIVGAAA